MPIDLTPINDTDWLACTDNDGITYKVSGANFKGLFAPPSVVPWEITTTKSDFKYYPFFIPNSTEDPTITINWGDGSPEETFKQSGIFPADPHVYATPGTYSLTATSKDNACPSGGYSLDVAAGAQIVTSLGPPSAGYKLPSNSQYFNSKFQKIVDTTWSFITDFDFSNVENLSYAFNECNTMVSFPFVSLPKVNVFIATWYKCGQLVDFPANMFDASPTFASNTFYKAFTLCRLSTQSAENILVSIDTNNQSDNMLDMAGSYNPSKSTWTAAANTAYDNLIAKGWTINYTA